MLQEFLKHAVPDYLVKDTDLFSLRLPNKILPIANTTTAVSCEQIIIIPFWGSDLQEVFFGVAQNFSN